MWCLSETPRNVIKTIILQIQLHRDLFSLHANIMVQQTFVNINVSFLEMPRGSWKKINETNIHFSGT